VTDIGTKDNSSFLEEVGHEPILDGLVYSSELDIDLEGDILVVSRFSTSCFLNYHILSGDTKGNIPKLLDERVLSRVLLWDECDDELRRVLGTVSSLSSSLNERSADIHSISSMEDSRLHASKLDSKLATSLSKHRDCLLYLIEGETLLARSRRSRALFRVKDDNDPALHSTRSSEALSAKSPASISWIDESFSVSIWVCKG